MKQKSFESISRAGPVYSSDMTRNKKMDIPFLEMLTVFALDSEIGRKVGISMYISTGMCSVA